MDAAMPLEQSAINPTSHTSAPFLVFAVGNRSRGDDALGAIFLEQLQYSERGWKDIEFLEDFQLQIEHALDLQRRSAVLFVDAALPGTVDSVCLRPVDADQGVLPASHALRAEAVLNVAQRLYGVAPPSWQLAIEGAHFGLGEGLSKTAENHLQSALVLAKQWLSEQRQMLALRQGHDSLLSESSTKVRPCTS